MGDTPPPISSAPTEQKDHGWEIGCHLSALATLLQIPLGNVIAPLVLWLFRRAHSESLDRIGRHVLNFQISVSLYCGILELIAKILFNDEPRSKLQALFHVPWRGIEIASIALIIIAAFHASKGEWFRYPLTIRFIPEK